MSELLEFSQTHTDSAVVSVFGPVAFVEFEWASPDADGCAHRLVAAEAVRKVGRSRKLDKVSRLAKARGLVLLTDDGVEHLHRLGPKFLFYGSGISEDVLAKLVLYPLHGSNSVGDVLAEFAAMSEEEIARRVVETDFSCFGVWALGSSDEDGPVNVPVEFEVSNRYVHVDQALPHLQAHPDVAAVEFEEGRPGSYDHVPSYLRVTAKFSDEAWAAMTAVALDRYGEYCKKGDRPPAPTSSVVEELFVWRPIKHESPETGDPLGLTPFARVEEYEEPSAYGDRSDGGW